MSTDYKLRFTTPAAKEQVITVNGHKLACVSEFKEEKKQEIHEVRSIGQREASATVSGVLSFELTLTRELPEDDGIDFAELGVFRLVNGTAVYNGCKCIGVERTTKPDKTTVERVRIYALSRRSEAVNNTNLTFESEQTVLSDDGVNFDESLVFLVRRNSMAQLSDYFRRDARRYDNGYEIY